MHDRGCSGVPGEREREREGNDGEIQMRERGEREQVLVGRRGEKERRKEEDMWSGWDEMRKREGKERREILSEDGREI
jgi:hypothetical protein